MSDNNQPESIITNDPGIFETLEKTNPIILQPHDRQETEQDFNFILFCRDLATAKLISNAIADSRLDPDDAPQKRFIDGEKQLLTAILLEVANSREPTITGISKLMADIYRHGIEQTFRRSKNSDVCRIARPLSELPANVQESIIKIVANCKLRFLERASISHNRRRDRFKISGFFKFLQPQPEQPFDFTQLRTKPTQILWNSSVSYPPESTRPAAAAFFSLAFRDLLINDKGLKVRFIIPDLTDLGRLPGLETITILFKTLDILLETQVKDKRSFQAFYGKNNADTIIDNLNRASLANSVETAFRICSRINDKQRSRQRR
jgi:hypothetical protein